MCTTVFIITYFIWARIQEQTTWPLLEEKKSCKCNKVFFTLRKGEAALCNDVISKISQSQKDKATAFLFMQYAKYSNLSKQNKITVACI